MIEEKNTNYAPISFQPLKDAIHSNQMVEAQNIMLSYKDLFIALKLVGMVMNAAFKEEYERREKKVLFYSENPNDFTQTTADALFSKWVKMCFQKDETQRPFNEEEKHSLFTAVYKLLIVDENFMFLQGTYAHAGRCVLHHTISTKQFYYAKSFLESKNVQNKKYYKEYLPHVAFDMINEEIRKNKTYTIHEAKRLIEFSDYMIPFDKAEQLFYMIIDVGEFDTIEKLQHCLELRNAIPVTPFLSYLYGRAVRDDMPLDYYIKEADKLILNMGKRQN